MNIPIYNLVFKHLNKSKSVFLIRIVTCVFWGNLSGRKEFKVGAADNLLRRFLNPRNKNSFVFLGEL